MVKARIVHLKAEEQQILEPYNHPFRAGSLCCSPDSYLRPGALPDGDDPILLWVEDLPDLAHGLRVRRRCGEVSRGVQTAKQAAPAIVAGRGIG